METENEYLYDETDYFMIHSEYDDHKGCKECKNSFHSFLSASVPMGTLCCKVFSVDGLYVCRQPALSDGKTTCKFYKE